jgi:PPOX class probable F420-dependent enzyme
MASAATIIPIPETHKDLLTGAVVVTLVTVMPDGTPQATPVWVDYDGQYVIVNTARGRQKDRNMQRRSKVAVLAIDPKNPYRWLEVRGEVEDISEAGAVDVINKLAKKYRGVDSYYGGSAPAERATQETRVTYKIRPLHVNVSR